ncbi:MAG TPA: hypothetical protein VIT00_11310, partial [Terrimicrobiaceae bacterium]
LDEPGNRGWGIPVFYLGVPGGLRLREPLLSEEVASGNPQVVETEDAVLLTLPLSGCTGVPPGQRPPGYPQVESLDPTDDGLTSTVSGFEGRLLHVAPSVERIGSRVALQFTPIMNKDQRPRIRLCWIQEELTGNLRLMGWPMIWANTRRLKARLLLSKQAAGLVFAQRAFLFAIAYRFRPPIPRSRIESHSFFPGLENYLVSW